MRLITHYSALFLLLILAACGAKPGSPAERIDDARLLQINGIFRNTLTEGRGTLALNATRVGSVGKAVADAVPSLAASVQPLIEAQAQFKQLNTKIDAVTVANVADASDSRSAILEKNNACLALVGEAQALVSGAKSSVTDAKAALDKVLEDSAESAALSRAHEDLSKLELSLANAVSEEKKKSL